MRKKKTVFSLSAAFHNFGKLNRWYEEKDAAKEEKELNKILRRVGNRCGEEKGEAMRKNIWRQINEKGR